MNERSANESSVPNWLLSWRRLNRVSREKQIIVRLGGSAGIALLCCERGFQKTFEPHDLDVVVCQEHAGSLSGVLQHMGAKPDVNIALASGGDRERYGWCSLQVDVFIDPFRMCHDIHLGERLTWFPETLSPGDLLITKMQNISMKESDCLHIAWLLKAYPLASNKDMYGRVVASTCGTSWGLWETTRQNCGYLQEAWMNCRERAFPEGNLQIHILLSMLATCPKNAKWRLRSLVGRRLKWYREVEDA